MSLVNYDSTRKENCGVIYETHYEENKINIFGTDVQEIEKRNNKKHETVYKENHFDIESYDESVKSSINILGINNIVQKEGTKFSETTKEETIELSKPQTAKKEENPIDKNSNDAIYGNIDNRQTSSTKYDLKHNKYSKGTKNYNNEEYRNGISENIKKTRHKYDRKFNNLKTCDNNALKRNGRFNAKRKWSWNSGFLISLVMLNVAGQSCAEDSSNYTPGLTTRMLASFLGYPSTCAWGGGVRPCSLTLSCWLRGGTALSGCGGWLFSCCHTKEPSTEDLSNSIPSSDWQYKPPSPKLRVPQRTMPNNVFRRRVDDDVSQLDCGLPSSRILQKRIIGGREARFAEFPWQAHVRISEFQCGGVLVSRRYVATAAHCVSRAHTRDIAVWLGAIDTSATHHPARKLGVIQKILHPLFQFRMTQPDRYDIALLKLSRPITYMSHILPICLPDYDMDLRGRSGVIAGWGKTDASNGHTGTNLLRSATVPILSKEQCINWHQSKQISVEIHSEMICAGHSDGHQDACLGDSGGPLIVLDNGRYYLVGITSAGFGCGVDHQPGIYHNVKLTANWIRSVIAPSVNYNDNYLK